MRRYYSDNNGYLETIRKGLDGVRRFASHLTGGRGTREENIDLSEDCTMCLHDQYWSARYTIKHGLVRGSMVAGIVLKEG